MIITPVLVNDTAGGTELVSPALCLKFKAVVIQNLTGAVSVAVSFDGGGEALTFANGLVLEAGMERVIEFNKGSFSNGVKAIADTATSSTLRVHLIS